MQVQRLPVCNHQAQFKEITRIPKQMYRVEKNSTGKQAVIKLMPSAQS